MKSYQLDIKLETMPPVFERHQHVLILIHTPEKKYILGTKKHYPPHISRLIGGGMEPHEQPIVAAQRELAEEMGVMADITDLKPLARVEAHLSCTDRPILTFTTYLFSYYLSGTEYHPSSDLDGIVILDKKQYDDLIARFMHLEGEKSSQFNFKWSDYGRVYGPIHRIALEELKKNLYLIDE